MAEEIGYSIVGEQQEYANNVINYNIRKEQTKDAFNAINANNQTTTGMANVIPGINAPKLIASTSIIGLVAGGGGQYAIANVKCPQNRVGDGRDEDALPEGEITLTEYTDGKFSVANNELTAVDGGTYLFSIEQTNFIRSTVSTDYYVRTIVTLNGTSVIDGRVNYGPTGYKRSGPLIIPAGGVLKFYGMLWNISSAIAPIAIDGGEERDVSLVRLG